MDWFFGFKLHLFINHHGKIIDFHLTAGNVDDRRPVKGFSQKSFGLLIGDKGYLGAALRDDLAENSIQLITPVRRNMKPPKRTSFERYLLQHRSLVKTVNDELKNLCQIEHTWHRSSDNFLINLMAGLVVYCLTPKKPKLPINTTYPLQNLAA